MTRYHCVIRASENNCWVTSGYEITPEDAVEYAATFESTLVEIVAAQTGIRPPVGIKADQCSHVWVTTIKLRGEQVLGMGEKLVPR